MEFRHREGVPEDVQVIATPGLFEIQMAVADVIEDNGCMIVTGPNGCGKTSSVDFALQAAAEDNHGLRWAEIRATANPNPKVFLETLGRALGVSPPRRATVHLLTELVADVLTREHWVVWLDEIENAAAGTLKTARYLFDTPRITSSLVLTGNQTARRHLRRREPGLSSRACPRVSVAPLADDEAPALMAQYWSLFANTDPQVLRRINRLVRGEFRQWAHVAAQAHKRGSLLDPMPEEITPELFNLIKGPMEWR